MNKSLADEMRKNQLKYTSIDLFSGPGGLATGFRWSGIMPLIAVEWAPGTAETYAINHNADILELDKISDNDYLNKFKTESINPVLIYGDINKVSNELILDLLNTRYGIDPGNEPINVVSGGAPCESFSMAGKRVIGDKRDTLFENILRVSKAVHTDVILFENVKGLLSKPLNNKKGEMFEFICNEFERKEPDFDYNLVSKDPKEVVLKAVEYGVPQNRERLFLVAVNSNKNIKFKYPEKKFGNEPLLPYINVGEAILDLPAVSSGEETTIYKYPVKFNTEVHKRFIDIMRGTLVEPGFNSSVPEHLIDKGYFNEGTISSHKGPGHTRKKRELLELIPPEESMKSTFNKLTELEEIDEYRHLFPKVIYGSRNRRLIENQPSFTVTSHCLDEILHPFQNRAITPREAARLQSFPDWYQFTGPYVVFHSSHIQDRYEQIGDAIPPLLAHAIGLEIVNSLENVSDDS